MLETITGNPSKAGRLGKHGINHVGKKDIFFIHLTNIFVSQFNEK